MPPEVYTFSIISQNARGGKYARQKNICSRKNDFFYCYFLNIVLKLGKYFNLPY